jgi:hypothetical protein
MMYRRKKIHWQLRRILSFFLKAHFLGVFVRDLFGSEPGPNFGERDRVGAGFSGTRSSYDGSFRVAEPQQ